MTERFIINASVEFRPASNTLVSLSSKENITQLNAPTSRCLALLIERRYSVVPQNDFYQYVWGAEGVNVSINTLYQNLSLLRKALRTVDEGWDKMVVTVPKQGFKLNEAFSIVSVLNVDASPPETERHDDLPVVDENHSLAPVVLPLDKKVGINKRLLTYCNFLGAVVLSGLLIYQLYMWETPPTAHYLSKYKNEVTIAGCHIYANAILDEKQAREMEKNIKSNGIDCKKNTYNYVTHFQDSPHTSFLSCGFPLEGKAPPHCLAYQFYSTGETTQ